MDEPITYDAYLEVERSGRWIAHILDLPGCYAYGPSQDASLAALVVAIPAYFAWLKRHDEYTPDVRGPWRVALRETFHTVMLGDYEVNAFFSPDAEPVDDESLDWYLALLGWAHEDLLALVRAAPPAALDFPISPGEWTLRPMLHHVAITQVWYVSRLEAAPASIGQPPADADPVEVLQRVHAVCVRRLRNVTDQERTAVREHQGERWSMRKVLRRSVWHLLDHTDQAQRMLAAGRGA